MPKKICIYTITQNMPIIPLHWEYNLERDTDGSLPEAIGMAYSRQQDGVIWTFNDSGGANKIFAISEQGDT